MTVIPGNDTGKYWIKMMRAHSPFDRLDAASSPARCRWGMIYRRGNRFWVKYYRNGLPIRESSRSTNRREAENLLAKRWAQTTRGEKINRKAESIKIDELLQGVQTEYLINGRKSVRHVKRRVKKHLLPFFGGMRAAAVTTLDVREFVLQRQERGASNATINRELSILKRAYSLGIQAGLVANKPFIQMLPERNVRTGFFEQSQFAAMLQHLSEDLRPMLAFAYITGWRIPSEILKLQWRHIDYVAGTVRLDPGSTKNGEGRVFPFTKELHVILETQRANTDTIQREQGILCPFVFHRQGRQIKSFSMAWKSACRKAGVPGRIPHDLRRTAVRNLVRAGVSERVAMTLTGHKTRSVFERYNIVSEGDLRDAATKLDAQALIRSLRH
jgi:integrase